MIIKMMKDPVDFRKFLVFINKWETKLDLETIRKELQRITKMKFRVESEVPDKARLGSPIINNRKLRKRWKDREIEIPEPDASEN